MLGQVRSASGSKYSDEGVTFWSKGDTALLDLGTRRYVDCRLNRERGPWEEARRRGVNFRAIGQQPAWSLEIQHERNMLLVTDFGSRRLLAATPEPVFDGEIERYQVPADDLQVEIRPAHCTDSVTGASFTHKVTVTVAGQRYQGCGLSLEPRWE